MAQNISHDLQYLRHLLSNLPDTVLHGDIYDFRNFEPDPQLVELYGTNEAAVNNVLEVTFAPRGRVDGPSPFPILEQGPGLVAIVDVLQRFITEFPQSAIMKKWLEDFLKAAVHEIGSSGEDVSHTSNLF